jgi:hypothetical protein
MYAETITRLLEMTPAGLTDQQLLWHMRRAGLRLGAGEIVQSLTALADAGVAQLAPGRRWRLAQFERRPPAPATASSGAGQPQASGETLRAVPAIPIRRADRVVDGLPDQESDTQRAPRADRDWRSLLA